MAAVGTQGAGEKAALQMKHSSNAKSGRAEDDNLMLLTMDDLKKKGPQDRSKISMPNSTITSRSNGVQRAAGDGIGIGTSEGLIAEPELQHRYLGI
jgi:hypothetical protein